MKKLKIAVDFDGTIAEDSFPEVGSIRKGSQKYLQLLADEGHKIIINTCRTGRFEGMAEDFLLEHDIPFKYINNNLPKMIKMYKQDCRKISADYYIDNRNIGGLPSWKKIYKIINKAANE